MIRRFLAKAYLRLIGWTILGTPPDREHIGILLAAPHTSNMDFPLMLSTAYASNLRPKYLAKKELFNGPAKYWWTITGGVPIDRKNPGTIVEDLTRRASSGESFILVIAPEGTRKLTTGWKSGFYRIAMDAEIPVTPCSVDSVTKEIWFGPTFRLTGDVSADMDRMREFYEDKRGVDPSKKSPVRLAMEDADGSEASGTSDGIALP